jgi:all-trans-retinol dehydrogenase (NAD+)
MAKPTRIIAGTIGHTVVTLLSPLGAGSILALLTHAPDSVRDVLAKYLPSVDVELLFRLKGPLKVVLALGLLRRVNAALNVWGENNWRISGQSGWYWPSEIAVVTGGSSGIGLAVVEGLLKKGVKVAILDIQPPPKALESRDDVLYVECDVGSSDSVGQAADKIRAAFGHPSILVNNAGLSNRGTGVLERTEASLRTIVNVNLIAHWLTVQQFAPHMVAQNKGHIVSVASMAAYSAFPHAVDYGATKAGALALHEGLRSELKHLYKAPNVMTTICMPAWVRTPMTDPFRERIESNSGPMMEAEDVARPILAQIFNRKSGMIILPKRMWLASSIRSLPNWLQRLIADAIGSSNARGYNYKKDQKKPFIQSIA